MTPAPEDELGYKPLDGGWGWMIVLGAHISIGFAYSTPKVLSIFYNDIQEDLGSTSSEVAWISSIMLAAMYAGGPVSSVLVNHFGSRPVAIVGGLMSGVSMAIAAYSNSMIYLYIFIGFIAGCGFALNLNASLNIISKYFLAKRPLANGLAMAGSPVFLFVLAPVNQYLLIQFGWCGSLLILGGLILNCCVSGALMRPVILPRKPSSSTPEKKMEERPNDSNTKLKESFIKNFKKFLDFSFFRDRGFVIYLIGNMMFCFGAYAPAFFLSAYAISQGVEEYSAAYLLSIMGSADIIARPTTGLIANSKWIRPRIQYFFSFAMVFNGMTHLLAPLMKSYTLLVVYAVLYGLSFGMVFALVFECLMDLLGNQRFTRAIGLVTIIECFPMLLGPPAGGLLVDICGEYKYLFIMSGSVILTGGVFLFAMNMYHFHMVKKEDSAKDREQDHDTKERQNNVEMKQIPEAAAEQIEPEAKEKNGAQGDPCTGNAE